MRAIARVTLVLLLLALASGPLAAAPLYAGGQAASSSPASSGGGLAARLLALGGSLIVFGAIRIKDTNTLAKKFVQRASAAGADYKDGVLAAGGDWEQNTKAAEDSYAQGVTAAIGDKRFGKGVSAAGAGKYTQRASSLGAARYPQGVQASEGAWSQGVQPYIQALAGMTLPMRKAKGDPNNLQRSQVVANTLRAIRTGK
jgi:hypothetical protein